MIVGTHPAPIVILTPFLCLRTNAKTYFIECGHRLALILIIVRGLSVNLAIQILGNSPIRGDVRRCHSITIQYVGQNVDCVANEGATLPTQGEPYEAEHEPLGLSAPQESAPLTLRLFKRKVHCPCSELFCGAMTTWRGKMWGI